MMLKEHEVQSFLKELRIEEANVKLLNLKDISTAFQKLALLLHPDNAGEESTESFQKLHNAYEKLRNHIINVKECNVTEHNNFF